MAVLKLDKELDKITEQSSVPDSTLFKETCYYTRNSSDEQAAATCLVTDKKIQIRLTL